MSNCPRCGAPLRDGASFCTSCGCAVSGGSGGSGESGRQPQSGRELAPLIVLAPQTNAFASKRRMAQLGKMAAMLILIVAVAVGSVFAVSMIGQTASQQNNFASSDISDDKYQKCIALVQDVRNDNLDSIMSDLLKSEGVAENYYFFSEYEKAFNNVLGDDYTPTEKKFSQCCMMVAFTEFTAKKYKYYSESMLFGEKTLSKQAETFRNHADTLWNMLNEAESDSQLQAIIDYCDENDIIRLKS